MLVLLVLKNEMLVVVVTTKQQREYFGSWTVWCAEKAVIRGMEEGGNAKC
jgi:hypothetical protein